MLNFREITILSGEQTRSRKLCKVCGHSMLLGKKDKVICNHCGNYIFKDDVTEFNFRLREKMLRQKKYVKLTN